MTQAAAQLESEARYDLRPRGRFSNAESAIVLTLLSLVFIASAVFAPALSRDDGQYFSLCIFKWLTSLPCPACGLSHSFCAIVTGDFLRALKFNLLGPPLFLIFILTWIRSLCVLLKKNKFVFAFDRTARRVRIIRSLAIAFAVFGAARILLALLSR